MQGGLRGGHVRFEFDPVECRCKPYSALDAALALWSGRAPGLFHRWLGNRSVKGSITRKGRPELFRAIKEHALT